MKTLSTPLKIGALSALLFLTACGGGGGDNSSPTGGGSSSSSSSNSSSSNSSSSNASTAGTSIGPKKDLPVDPTARKVRVESDVHEATVYIEVDGTQVKPNGLEAVETSSAGHGSGFIMTSDGLVVTNAHVAVGQGLYKIHLNSRDRPISAQLRAIAECEDLAVLKMISGAPFPTLSWSISDPTITMKVAVAGFPYDVEATQTTKSLYTYNEGVVNTAVYRNDTSWSSADMFYHSADTAGGNSGGPIIEIDTGTVVGVHYAGANISGTRRNMALSSTTARGIVSDLLAGRDVLSIGISGEVFFKYLDASNNVVGYGVSGQTPPSQATKSAGFGVWVRGVAPGGKALAAGILPGDIITAINGVQLGGDSSMGTYCDAMRSGNPNGGVAVKFELVRPKAGGVACEGEINGRAASVKGTYTQACPEKSSSSSSSSSSSASSSASGFVYAGQVGSLDSDLNHDLVLQISNGVISGQGLWGDVTGSIRGGIASNGSVTMAETIIYDGSTYILTYTGTYNASAGRLSGWVAYGSTYSDTWSVQLK